MGTRLFEEADTRRTRAAKPSQMLASCSGTVLALTLNLRPRGRIDGAHVMSRAGKSEDFGGTHGRPHRLMAVWTARHDNGWVTSVVENPNGSFAAWAAPDGEGGGVYSIVDAADDGKKAATASLRRDAGHTDCSGNCTGWSLRTYAVFDRRPGVGRPAKTATVDERRKPAPARRIA
jgi:hypothetical protein